MEVSVRYTIKHMRNIASEYGGKCLNKVYIDVYSPLKWMCKRGHTWDAPYSIIRQGGWCIQCRQKEERLKQLHLIAEQHGGKCLTNEYKSRITKMRWQCKNGHIWTVAAESILKGQWCRKCAHARSALTIEEMRKLAESRGGKCLSTEYRNIYFKLKWQCKKGHIWMSKPGVVKNSNAWCPYCSGKARHTINDMIMLAKKKWRQMLIKIVCKWWNKIEMAMFGRAYMVCQIGKDYSRAMVSYLQI